METLVFPTIRVYANLTGTWANISSYVVSDIMGSYGMFENTPTAKTAPEGSATFDLNNEDDLFMPGLATSLPGWGKRTEVLFEVEFDGKFKRLLWVVDNITGDILDWGDKRVKVRVVDWMTYAAKNPLVLQAILTNKTISEAVQAIISAMPIPPKNTEYATGVDTFPTVFDNLGAKARALTEFQKLSLSEFAYIYLKKDGVYGETLVVEDRHSRLNTTEPLQIPVSPERSGALLSDNNGFVILQENGVPILLNKIDTPSFDNATYADAKVTPDELLLNDISISAFPKRLDTSNQILSDIAEPIYLGAGQSYSFKVNFVDPYGGGTQINGTDMVTPVTGTHVQMWTNSAGNGANLSGNLVFSATFGAGDVFWQLQNTGSVGGYVTRLRAEGIGVYPYDPQTFESSLTVTGSMSSIAQYGSLPLAFDQRYQSSYSVSEGIGTLLASKYGSQRNILDYIKAIANISYEAMMIYIYGDIGSKIYVGVQRGGIAGYHYVQGVNFVLNMGGYIDYTFYFVEPLVTDDYWLLEVAGSSELGQTTVLGI